MSAVWFLVHMLYICMQMYVQYISCQNTIHKQFHFRSSVILLLTILRLCVQLNVFKFHTPKLYTQSFYIIHLNLVLQNLN